jgi:predicted TIM-barrel fold metal-dependent hydrolase
MSSTVIDIHPHIISPDTVGYPQKPLFGIQSKWSSERPTPIEALIVAMDQAGVGKAAIVHSSTCYGYDCSYLADSLAKNPRRFTGVSSIDMLAPDNAKTAQHWIDRGFTGFRIFTGGSTKDFDPSALADPRSFPVWDVVGDKGLSICLQTDMTGVEAIISLAKRFPKVKIVIDHIGRPSVKDGPPYAAAAKLWSLVEFPNVYLKLSTHAFDRINDGEGKAETFLPKLVQEFTAKRIAWGSNFPASKGHLTEHIAYARSQLAVLSQSDQDWILGGTAQILYPALTDT